MNANDSAIAQAERAPVLPAPIPRQGKVSFVEYIRLMRDSSIAAFGPEAYELDIIERKILGRPRFIVNDPAAVKHVLLDNAANYEKNEIQRRILEPGLGKGLLTSEGETWKAHRRTMTPAFDQRSVAAYTAVMTGAAEELMGKWDSVGHATTVDVSIAMMEVTLQIISRTMFSSDADGMAAIMERSFGEYQAQMRPNLLDFIGMPAWLAGLGRMNVAKRTLREFNAVIDRLIATRTRNPESSPKDLLGRLIAARDEQTGTRMTAQEVRDNIITIFMAIELMLNAVNLAFVAFARAWNQLDGLVFVFFVIVVAAAEAAVGLAIVITIVQNRQTLNVERVNLLKL